MNLQELSDLYNFKGRTIVVTGGTGILGKEIVCALVGCGANVAVLNRNPDLAERLVDRHGCDGSTNCAISVYANVLQRHTLDKASELIRTEFGPVYGLINAAGGNNPRATTRRDLPFFDLPEEAMHFVVDLNLYGTILPTQVFSRQMAEAKEGVILNVSSMNALRPLTNIPAYAASKAAVTNFTQWLAVHLATEYSPRIRVNAIAPGFYLTDQNRYLLTVSGSDELTERGQAIIAHTPMRRFGNPEDLLGTVLWLMSPASGFVTGIVVPIDGGFSAFGGV